MLKVGDADYRVTYTPGESDTDMFGGNSNWRGPIWFPVNHLLVEALDHYHAFYGPNFCVEYPTQSGEEKSLHDVAIDLRKRLSSLFRMQPDGGRPCHGGAERFAKDPHWKDLVLFHEFFHGDSGKGLGASHQTGWTALVATHLDELVRNA